MIRKLTTYTTKNLLPYRNQAVEEYLTFHTEPEECILYLWQNRKTVVIGKNQNCWKECRVQRLEEDGGYFYETTPYAPHSPYSASKASSDMLVKAYMDTYKFPANITNCSNNYGPYQFPEKLIPLMINNALHGRKLPVYGDGKNVRD